MMSRRNLLLNAGSFAALAIQGAEPFAQGASRSLYVAPAGKDGDYPLRGTAERPFATLPHAFACASGGDRILLRGGVYGFGGAAEGWLLARHGGVAGSPIVIENHPGESPVIDGAAMRPPTERYQAWHSPRSAGGFPLVILDASHLILRGITIRHGPMGGCLVDGIHHDLSIERCIFHDNGWLNDEYGTGLALLGTGHRNVVRNCDSFGNRGGGAGATGGNADGISVSLEDSVGTVVTGNRAWRNTDDGFDFFNPAQPGASRDASPCLIDQNWAFENGCDADGSISPSEDANGCGFKLGGRRAGATGRHGGHTITRCLAWSNKTSGFDDNGYTGGLQPLTVFNNVSFNNARGGSGYAFVIQHHARSLLCNNIAFAAGGVRDFLIDLVLQSHNASNGPALGSLSPPSFKVSLSDFQSVKDAIARGPRQADGTLPVSGFLRLAPGSRLIGAGTAAGLPLTVSSGDGLISIGAFEGP